VFLIERDQVGTIGEIGARHQMGVFRIYEVPVLFNLCRGDRFSDQQTTFRNKPLNLLSINRSISSLGRLSFVGLSSSNTSATTVCEVIPVMSPRFTS
jgi:hypothetical protein